MPVSYKFIFEACDDYKHVLGSVTGKQTLHIPWGKLVKEPSKWLMKRCYPKHFQWRDPSKIRIDETFQLIQHWRDRISRGRESLIWVKTSPLFKDLQGGSRLTRNSHQGSSVEQESSEENFDLSSSSDEEGVTGEAQEVPSSGSDADADTADESGEGQDKGLALLPIAVVTVEMMCLMVGTLWAITRNDQAVRKCNLRAQQPPPIMETIYSEIPFIKVSYCYIVPFVHTLVSLPALGSDDRRSLHSSPRASNVYVSPTSGGIIFTYYMCQC